MRSPLAGAPISKLRPTAPASWVLATRTWVSPIVPSALTLYQPISLEKAEAALRKSTVKRAAPSPVRKGWLAMPLMAEGWTATPSARVGR